MTNSILFVFLSFLLLIACAKPDKSILVKEGDDLLDCRALANEFEFAKNLGANASSRGGTLRPFRKRGNASKNQKSPFRLVSPDHYSLLLPSTLRP